MNIGFISTRLAGLDGVSLETTKLAHTFEAMGHKCFYCAGELDPDRKPGRLVPQMHFLDPHVTDLCDRAYGSPEPDAVLIEDIYGLADILYKEIAAFVDEYDIDLLVSQNANAMPLHLPLGVAITEYAKRNPSIKLICHNHDFYWERDRYVINNVQYILDEAFPPRLPNVRHFTINTMMQRRLYSFRGIPAIYLPNVFDYENPPPPPDDYALTFRETVGLAEDDLIVLQPTRLIRRKSIEKAIELLRKLNDKRLVLILTGSDTDAVGAYGAWLKEECERAGIRYRFIADYLGVERIERNGHKVYTLWDVYPQAHFITYPSTYEGFGNALLETVYFRKPLVVNTYAMYLSDIKPVGIQAVEFSLDITQDTLEQTRRLIDDADWREQMVENNYKVATKHFSHTVLRQKLQQALEAFDAV